MVAGAKFHGRGVSSNGMGRGGQSMLQGSFGCSPRCLQRLAQRRRPTVTKPRRPRRKSRPQDSILSPRSAMSCGPHSRPSSGLRISQKRRKTRRGCVSWSERYVPRASRWRTFSMMPAICRVSCSVTTPWNAANLIFTHWSANWRVSTGLTPCAKGSPFLA